jgi:hypothetical protein
MQIYPDDTAKKRLERAAAATGRTVEDLATSAVEEAALDWDKANPVTFGNEPDAFKSGDDEHPMKAGITQDGEDLHKPHPLHDAIERDEGGEK